MWTDSQPNSQRQCKWEMKLKCGLAFCQKKCQTKINCAIDKNVGILRWSTQCIRITSVSCMFIYSDFSHYKLAFISIIAMFYSKQEEKTEWSKNALNRQLNFSNASGPLCRALLRVLLFHLQGTIWQVPSLQSRALWAFSGRGLQLGQKQTLRWSGTV